MAAPRLPQRGPLWVPGGHRAHRPPTTNAVTFIIRSREQAPVEQTGKSRPARATLESYCQKQASPKVFPEADRRLSINLSCTLYSHVIPTARVNGCERARSGASLPALVTLGEESSSRRLCNGTNTRSVGPIVLSRFNRGTRFYRTERNGTPGASPISNVDSSSGTVLGFPELPSMNSRPSR